MTPKANTPLIPQRLQSNYVVVREKNGGSPSNTTKNEATKGLQTAEKVTVLAQRSTKGSYLPHYMNGQNASIFGNRLGHGHGLQAGIDARQNKARAAQQQMPTGGGMFSSGMGADAGMMMAMQALNGGMGLIGQGLSAFRAPAGTKAPTSTKSEAPSQKAPTVDGSRSVVDVGADVVSSSAIDTSVSNMKSATTAAELRGEITTAQTLLGQYKEQLTNLENSADYKNAKANVGKLETAFTEKEKLAEKATEAYTNAKAQVSGAQKGVDNALSVLANASKACANLFTAWQDLKGQLDGLNKDDPNYETAKADLEAKVNKAKKDYDDAKAAEGESQTAVDNAKANLKQKLEMLDKKKELAATAKNEMKKAEGERDAAKNAYDEAKKLIDKQKALKSKCDSLDKAIKEQENRLKSMDRKAEHKVEHKQRQNDLARAYMDHLEEQYGEHDENGTFTGFGEDAKDVKKIYDQKQDNITRRNQEMDVMISNQLQDIQTGQPITVDGITYIKQENGNFKAQGQQEVTQDVLIQRIKITHKSDYTGSSAIVKDES